VGVITGAESEAATAVARALATEGMSLMLIAQPGAHVRALAEELSETHGVRCFPASLDVTDPAAVDRIVMHAEQHVGTIDLLVNSLAGAMTEALRPTMAQRGRGLIVNLPPAPQLPTGESVVTIVNVASDDDAVSAILAVLS
jgi:short-subunit dehydrogenase